MPFEIARPGERYDLVVVTQGADLTVWQDLPPSRGRVLFDQINSYLAVPPQSLRARLRGVAKFAVGQHRKLQLDFRETHRRMNWRADVSTCCSLEQQYDIVPYNARTHRMLDFQPLADGHVKRDFAAATPLRLVWEGLPENVVTFREIGAVLGAFAATHPVELHIVTRPAFHRYMGRFVARDTLAELRKLVRVPVRLHEWRVDTVSGLAAAADLALIPLPLDHPLYAAKPENKLAYFWRLAVPTLTSASPSYARTMAEAGLDMACVTEDDWMRALRRFAGDEAARRAAGEQGHAYVNREHGEPALLERWDAAIGAALLQV